MQATRCIASSVPTSAFAGFRFPPEVITLAVRWDLRFGLSYRDVEELLAERGIDVDHHHSHRAWGSHSTSISSAADGPSGSHHDGDEADELSVAVKRIGRSNGTARRAGTNRSAPTPTVDA
jgi:IS6 family transposase